APITCPSAPTTIVFKEPPPPPPPGIRLNFEHKLNVQSKLDGASKPGVDITQVSVSDPDPNFTFPPNYFAGTTDYERLAERNVIVVLEAPSVHPQGGSLDPINPWTGDCTSVAGNPRQCSVSFAFNVLGGQKKTVIANYSSALATPELLTATPLCTDGEGKIAVWAKSAVSGATGYRLYRASASTPGTSVLVKDFTPGTLLPTSQANAYTDKGLNSSAQYIYKMVAYNGSVSSPQSAGVTDDASKRCPDLIVQSITLPFSPGYPAGTVLSGTTGHTFSAVIKNQGEGTGTSFDNLFFVNTVQHGLKKGITGGLVQNGTGAITSDTWNAPIVTTATTKTIEVCADQPPPKPGVIQEAPPAGIPTVGDNPAEENNCASATSIVRTINIIPTPITIQLECEKAGGTYDQNYCVIDYSQTSKLRWTVGGTPTSCSWVASDATGSAANRSYTITGNPFSLNNLLNKLNFKYQLECTR
ncbi:MAG: hypothetical protein G01um101417_500, partial [Parcubacteria group bacterium Gr01-1014_17]